MTTFHIVTRSGNDLGTFEGETKEHATLAAWRAHEARLAALPEGARVEVLAPRMGNMTGNFEGMADGSLNVRIRIDMLREGDGPVMLFEARNVRVLP
jgi:hypothetical protein